MRRFIFALVLGMTAALAGSIHAQGVPPAAATLSYDDVIAAPEASVGKTVSWVVRFNCLTVDIQPDGSVTNVRTLFEYRDEGGARKGRGVLTPEPKTFRWPEPPFVDRLPQQQPRVLSGTIAAVERTTAVDGRQILTPVLTRVTLDVLPADSAITPGAMAPGSTNGVSWPIVLREQKPSYTQDALREKIEGSVELSIVVQADGTVGDVRVVKSLDTQYGLDAAAVEAAKKWLFKPGLKDGKPVATIVSLGLEFRVSK